MLLYKKERYVLKKTSRVIAIAITMVLISQVKVNAAPISSEIQLQQNKNSLKQAKDKREKLEASIEKLDSQIEDYMMKIEQNKKLIGSTENDISATEKNITEIEGEVSTKKDIMAKRIKIVYMNNQTDYLEILLQSKSFSDLIARMESIGKIIKFDKEMIGYLDDKRAEVENQKKVIQEKQKGLLALKSENESKLVRLNSSVTSQKKLIEQAKLEENLFASKVDESQAKINSTMVLREKERIEAPKYNSSAGAAPVSDGSVMAYASSFLGTPYLWGGTSPSTGFDCSGFTQYVYSHFGVRLGRTTYDQIKNGYGVSKDELKPGDLVFFGQGGNPTHMGMYVGNNTYIHAPRTGDVIKISSMDRSDYITARRVK